MTLASPLSPDAIVELTCDDGPSALAELCTPIAGAEHVDAASLVAVLLERERLASTALGHGVAVPHGVHPDLTRIVASFGRSRRGIAFDAPDRRPVHLFFVLIRPPDAAAAHLKALAKVSGILANAETRAALLSADDRAAMHRILAARW